MTDVPEPSEANVPPPPPPGIYPPPPPLGPDSYRYVPAGMFFDPASGLTLPQGTELASVGRRIGAWFLSFLLLVVTLGVGYIVWGLIVWGRGQTPALQVLGMRVWRPDVHRNASWGYMALREIIGGTVDWIFSFITLLVSFVMFLATKEHKSLHDLIAGTVVLYDPNYVLAN
jgi:uncharacterized RDD family membrane protein YckC